MKKYKDLFIDFDDTLYDTRGCAQMALSKLYDHYGLSKHFSSFSVFSDLYWKSNVKLWSDYAKGLIERNVLTVERFRQPFVAAKCKLDLSDEYCQQLNDSFLQFTLQSPTLIDGAKDLLDYLRGKGYGLHICSNGFSEVQYTKLRTTGLEGYFDTVNLSEEAGANKPSRQFFDYAMRRSKASAETTLMIGDNYDTDIVGAMGLGMDGMLYNRWDPKFVPAGPVTYIVDKLSDIKSYL